MEFKIWCAYCKQEQDESVGYICVNCNEKISYNHNMFILPYDYAENKEERLEIAEKISDLFINRCVEVDLCSYKKYFLEYVDNNPYSILYDADHSFDCEFWEIHLGPEESKYCFNDYMSLYNKGFKEYGLLTSLYNFYCYDESNPRDLNKAYFYLSLLEKYNDNWILSKLADEYCNGVYLEKNIEKAKELYKKSGTPYDLARLFMLDKSDESINQILSRITKKKKPGFNKNVDVKIAEDNRYYILNSSYLDPCLAFNNILKAAKEGLFLAMLIVCGYYEKGFGTKKNSKKAFYWYKRCALRGDKFSMKKTADMYLLGKGVEQNKEEALKFYEAALKHKEKMYKVKNYYIPTTNIKEVDLDD